MLPPLDVGAAVHPLPIMHRHIEYFQIQFCGAENKIEVAKRVKIPEKRPALLYPFIIAPPEDLRPAQRIFEPLAKYGGERQTEKRIADKVQHAHCALLYRIDQARTVDEIASAAYEQPVKTFDFVRRYRHVGIIDSEDVPLRHGKSFTHGISFSHAVLPRIFDAHAGRPRDTLNLLPGPVFRMPFYKNEFRESAERRKRTGDALYRPLLIPRRDNDREGGSLCTFSDELPCHRVVHKAEPREREQIREETVEERGKQRNADWHEHLRPRANDLKPRYFGEIREVGTREPVLFNVGPAQSHLRCKPQDRFP